MTTRGGSEQPPSGGARGSFHAPAPIPAVLVGRVLDLVRKPGRYWGGEWNSMPREWAATPLKWCLAYPDLYEIGMSNLGLRILYEVLNERPDCLAERCFAPDVDLSARLRTESVPLWSLETRRSLREFDVVGLSLGYELVAANILEMLDLAGIALRTRDRAPDDPLVIAGGATILNPEPLADFIDAAVLGEGEDVVGEISDVLLRLGWNRRRPAGRGATGRGADRATVLRALAAIPGVYVPSLYRPRYEADGRFAGLDRLDDSAPAGVAGRIASDFETRVRGIRQLVPNVAIVFDRAQVEVMRGCTRGCRFCQAGMASRPLRERPADVAVAAADAILAATGYEEIGLTSLSTADYTYVREVAAGIHAAHPDVTVSLPSTRVDSFTVELVDAIAPTGRRSGFTFAPEAGSQRLRDTINKGVGDEEILRCAELAFESGWSSIKLYFMIGLPGETMSDVLGIAEISRRILELGRRRHGGRAQLKAALSTFVPKVGTPFQWDGQDSTEEIGAKVAALRRTLHGKGLTMAWHDPEASLLEAALGRGDRRLGAVIEAAWRKGARLDAWDQHFRFDLWRAAFVEAGLDPEWYACRDIPTDEPLPWSHLGSGVATAFLLRDRRRALAAKTTPDCHWGPCANCGVPAATGFACDTGDAGPRRLLVRLGDDSGPGEPADQTAPTAGGSGARGRVPPAGRFRYVGPPGDSRRRAVGGADEANAEADEANAEADGANAGGSGAATGAALSRSTPEPGR